MARLDTIDPALATGKTKVLLDSVKAKLGLIPNMTRVMANSPAVLEAYLGFLGALASGKLSTKLREQIALAVAETNECSYCLSAHSAIGAMVGLSPAELTAARQGVPSDARAASALAFARRILQCKGDVTEAEVQGLRDAGFGDAEIAEIIAHVALNVFTNYFNRATGVDIDFTPVRPGVFSPA